MEEKDGGALPRPKRPWLCAHRCKKVSRVLPEKIPSHIVIVNETRPHDLVRL